MMVNKPLD